MEAPRRWSFFVCFALFPFLTYSGIQDNECLYHLLILPSPCLLVVQSSAITHPQPLKCWQTERPSKPSAVLYLVELPDIIPLKKVKKGGGLRCPEVSRKSGVADRKFKEAKFKNMGQGEEKYEVVVQRSLKNSLLFKRVRLSKIFAVALSEKYEVEVEKVILFIDTSLIISKSETTKIKGKESFKFF